MFVKSYFNENAKHNDEKREKKLYFYQCEERCVLCVVLE